MKRTNISLVQILLLGLLLGCSNFDATPRDAQQSAASTPEAGKTTVTGRIMAATTNAPLASTSVRLAEVYREGGEAAFVLDGARSPGAVTDENGIFVMTNIDPREYVLVVGDPYADNIVVANPDGKAKVWNAAADQVLNMGDVAVNLTPGG